MGVQVKELEKLYSEDNLKKSSLERFVSEIKKGTDLLMRNLYRSADLISRFKKIAVDQEAEHISLINIKDYIDETITSLDPVLQKRHISIENRVDESIKVETDPGAVYQIFTNLIMNALIHGFEGKEGTITISSNQMDNKTVLSIENDGRPISPEVRENIFEPFITTRRHKGGTGLGLHIVYNLVSTKLNGHIKLASDDTPVRFEIEF